MNLQKSTISWSNASLSKEVVLTGYMTSPLENAIVFHLILDL